MAERKKRGDLGKEKPKSKHKSKGDKKVHEIHLRRANSGELIGRHKHRPDAGGQAPEDEEHIIPDDGVQDHVDQHLPPSQPEPDAPPAGPPPPNPLAGAMGGM